jgi:hypothetical protein
MTPAALDRVSVPGEEAAAELLSWRPPLGVVSLYVDADPGDRGHRWRTEIKNGLDAAAQRGMEGAERERRLAIEATVERIEAGFLAEARNGHPRGAIGFVETAREPGEERWYATQLAPRRTEVTYGPLVRVAPLVALVAEGAPLGIAAVSSERVRLFDWRFGQARRIHAWEIELFSGDWRERKARRSRSAAGPAVSAAGRDQHDQRLEANRARFAHQTGKLAGAEASRRGWRELLTFGDERYAHRFAEGYARRTELRHVDSSDLISEPTHRIEERVELLLPGLNRERDLALIEAIKDAAFKGARSALGVQETLQALAEGRVEHLVLDPDRDYEAIVDEEPAPGSIELPLVERMIELAVSSGAVITVASPGSARALDPQGGVAALLRY